MKLTGKCKTDFEKWLSKLPKYKHYTFEYTMSLWENNYLDSMQYGVLVDFFDSVGIIIDIHPILNYNQVVYTDVDGYIVWVRKLGVEDDDSYDPPETDSKPKAREKAILKANEIYNENKRTN